MIYRIQILENILYPMTSERDKQTKGPLQRARNFWKCSCNFVRESRRPSAKEFKEVLKGHLTGFVMLGLFAYVIKVIHIPINNMIVGSDKQ